MVVFGWHTGWVMHIAVGSTKIKRTWMSWTSQQGYTTVTDIVWKGAQRRPRTTVHTQHVRRRHYKVNYIVNEELKTITRVNSLPRHQQLQLHHQVFDFDYSLGDCCEVCMSAGFTSWRRAGNRAIIHIHACHATTLPDLRGHGLRGGQGGKMPDIPLSYVQCRKK